MAKMSDSSRAKGMDVKEAASLLISVITLIISGATFYIQLVWERSRLTMRLMDFALEPQADGSPICKLEVSLFNSGNRDSALTQVHLRQGKTAFTPTGSTTESVSYFPPSDSPGYVSYVVKSGEIRFVSLVFLGCDFQSVKSGIEKKYIDLSLATVAMNYEGKVRMHGGSARARYFPALYDVKAEIDARVSSDDPVDMLMRRAVGVQSAVF